MQSESALKSKYASMLKGIKSPRYEAVSHR